MAEVDTTAANATENVNTNTEATTEAPKTEAPADNGLGLTAEQTEQFKKFLDANGGYEKVFAKVKQDVTGRGTDKKDEPEPKSEPEQGDMVPQATTQQPTQPEAPRMAEGFVSPQEFALRQYFKAIASEEKYAPIAKEINSGAVLKEMEGLGIKATDAQGNYNDSMIRRFLDLKAKTVPATPSVVEPSTTPTVEYTNTEGEIKTMEQALKIQAENRMGLARGAGAHPNIEAARKFMAEQINGKK